MKSSALSHEGMDSINHLYLHITHQMIYSGLPDENTQAYLQGWRFYINRRKDDVTEKVEKAEGKVKFRRADKPWPLLTLL